MALSNEQLDRLVFLSRVVLSETLQQAHYNLSLLMFDFNVYDGNIHK